MALVLCVCVSLRGTYVCVDQDVPYTRKICRTADAFCKRVLVLLYEYARDPPRVAWRLLTASDY